MGASAKKALKKELNKILSSTPLTDKQKSSSGFLVPEKQSGVLYIGSIPHGFYEEEMKYCFSQFGTIKRLRMARNKKVGEVVADLCITNLLFEQLLQVYAIPREHVYPKLWKGFDYFYNPVCRHQIERKQQNQKRKKMIEATGLDYECPEFIRTPIVGDVQSVPDKIKFNLE
ncbi:RNA-binding protein [Salix suchowensis]|nr:RNA-binding protein [Salix suchowensis]